MGNEIVDDVNKLAKDIKTEAVEKAKIEVGKDVKKTKSIFARIKAFFVGIIAKIKAKFKKQ